MGRFGFSNRRAESLGGIPNLDVKCVVSSCAFSVLTSVGSSVVPELCVVSGCDVGLSKLVRSGSPGWLVGWLLSWRGLI
jgi:hypothetical protein